VLFNVRNKITHIDVKIYHNDLLFFGELKRVDEEERGMLRKWFSIWTYHHCNFDNVIDLNCRITEGS
jgi:hypothetical protein